MKLDEAYMLAEENLTNKEINKAEENLDNVIALIDTGINDPLATNGKFSIPFTDDLKVLCSKFWVMKEKSKEIKENNPAYEAAQKANRIWTTRLYPKLLTLNNKITSWNNNHPNNQLPSVKELCGFDIRATVKTKG